MPGPESTLIILIQTNAPGQRSPLRESGSALHQNPKPARNPGNPPLRSTQTHTNRVSQFQCFHAFLFKQCKLPHHYKVADELKR